MEKALEVRLTGWTATPRMPFVLSGNAICLPTPTYSLLLGLVGCCLGRVVEAKEIQIGFNYEFDSVGRDLETRQRLEFDGKKIKGHMKGSDAYNREFHVLPKLTLWIDRIDWENFFLNPIGTPSLGRSQDILKIESVQQVKVRTIEEAELPGCMLPFNSNLKISGQLVQLAEAFEEGDSIGSGRKPTKTRIFMAVANDNKAKIKMPNLFQTIEEKPKNFYLHKFGNAN